ncbi:MAG TPA: hypothetical protein VKG23_16415 [Thermoanaerobaculia bacterium]|nr:hypothetical protein [Thermoanaerobaculia bacterium]
MNAAARRRVLEYVRPLAVGLDGMTNYGDVERMISAAEAVANGAADVDHDLLFLLAVFSGQEKWVSRMGHRSRTELFLASLGVRRETVRALFRGLGRFESTPVGPEEEAVHDALRLETLGAYGVARGLADAYRERLDILEIADALEAAAKAPLRTENGRRLAAPRRERMLEFARALRAEHAEFSRAAKDRGLR